MHLFTRSERRVKDIDIDIEREIRVKFRAKL
jgi:hypothetical protein